MPKEYCIGSKRPIDADHAAGVRTKLRTCLKNTEMMEDVGYRDAPHPKNKQYPADTERIGIVLVCVCLCLIANVMKPNRLEK